MLLCIRKLGFVCLLALVGLPAFAQDWFETTIEIAELTEAGDFVSAAEIAPLLLERAATEFGEESLQVAESHMLVAGIHMATETYIAAEDSILNAVRIYEALEGPLSTTLIVPYADLGDAYFESGEYELAIGAYNEARGLSRRAYGLENALQIPLIYKEASVVEELGDLDTATDLQVDAVRLIQSNFGPSSEESLAGLLGLAEWLNEKENYVAAGNQYRAASELLQYALDGNELEIIETLRRAADNYRLGARSFNTNNGPRRPSELFNALSIARSLGSDYLLIQAEIWRDIGDWYVAFGDRFSIAEPYLRAIALLQEYDGGEAIIEDWFTGVTPVYMGSFDAGELSTDESAARGTVELEFLIQDNGTVDKIDVIAADPPDLVDRDARRYINNSRFRPIIEDGQIVAAVRRFTVEYRYDPEHADQ